MLRSLHISMALSGLLAGMCLAPANAQTLFLDPPRQHISNRPFAGPETMILNLMVDGGIDRAVSWGTSLSLGNDVTSPLEFVPFAGTSSPFRSTQAFFDTDFSLPFNTGDYTLNLFYLNLTPGAELGLTGTVTLGQVQVRVNSEPGYPGDADYGATVNVADLDIPSDGSAVQDSDGNNLLHSVNGASITSRPPTPEPASWLTPTFGIIGYLLLRRRTRRAAHA